MCPWVGPHAPSIGRQLLGLPSRLEYLSPQGVLLPRVYGTTASPLWRELRGPAAWQTTPSWTVYRLACHQLLPWLQVTFAMVPNAAWPGSDQRLWGTAPVAGPVGRLGCPSAPDPRGAVCRCSCLGRPWCARVCSVLGNLASVHRCARSVCCLACAVSWATCLLFTAVPAWCLVLRVRCPGCLAPVHRCPRSLCCVAVAVFWATWLLITDVLASCLVLCVCGVLGHWAPVHLYACSVGCVACAVSWATWLLFTGLPARCVASRVRCRRPLGSCSPLCWLSV